MHREVQQEKRSDARPQCSLFCQALLPSGFRFASHSHSPGKAATVTRYNNLTVHLTVQHLYNRQLIFHLVLHTCAYMSQRFCTAATNSEQKTICPLFTQILSPICDVCSALPEERGVNRCTGRGARVTAGHKNAYSSLWLVHKLAAGRLGGWG